MLHDPMKDYDAHGQLLLKAAAHIEEHGWCQNSLQTKTGQVCAIGALNIATTGSPKEDGHTPEDRKLNAQCRNQLLAKIEEQTGEEAYFIASWNNDRERTQAEVIALFKTVAEQHRLVKA